MALELKANAQDVINVLTLQRNQSLDQVVVLSAENIALKVKLDELERRLTGESLSLMEDDPQAGVVPMRPDCA